MEGEEMSEKASEGEDGILLLTSPALYNHGRYRLNGGTETKRDESEYRALYCGPEISKIPSDLI